MTKGSSLHPLEKRRLVTAHVESRPWVAAAGSTPVRRYQTFTKETISPRRRRDSDSQSSFGQPGTAQRVFQRRYIFRVYVAG
jgi:hypothetical protein